MTPEQIKKARKMRDAGASWNSISREIGVAAETVHITLDPEYKARRMARINELRRQRYAGNAEVIAPVKYERRAKGYSTHQQTRADAEKRMAEIPPDTRGFTARLCGDPLPGRSALDKRRAVE